MAAWTGAYAQELLNDLRRVGPTKPLGYLPLSTIQNCDVNSRDLRQELDQKGLHTLIILSGTVSSGALYAFDLETLSSLLSAHSEVLAKAGWPNDPQAFVRRVATISVSPDGNPDLYRLIGKAFDDPRFREPRDGA